MRNILCLLSIVLFSSHCINFYETITIEKPIVIIDPGHGGVDGGATGLKNIPESI